MCICSSDSQKGGSTTWCTEANFGTDGCPADLSDVTAFRIQRGAPVAVGDTVTHQIALATDGAHNNDTYANRFGLRASNLDLAVQSNPATIRVVSGSIGDHVWTDKNSNGIQDDDEPGIENVAVRLTGTDDLGAKVDRTTTTDADGNYRFGGLRPGEYVVTFTAPDGRKFTQELAGDDRAKDSDATSDGSTAATTIAQVTTPEGALDGVDRIDTIDAGILPLQDVIDPPGPVDPGFTVTPELPVDPDQPVDPGFTVTPELPVDPDHPVDPGFTVTPNKPEKPTTPGTTTPGTTTPEKTPGASRSDRVPAKAHAKAKTGELAFTGAEHLPLIITCSLVLLGLGTALAFYGTRRSQARKR